LFFTILPSKQKKNKGLLAQDIKCIGVSTCLIGDFFLYIGVKISFIGDSTIPQCTKKVLD